MACSLVGAKPLSETRMEYCQSDPQEQTSVNRNSYIFIEENEFGTVVGKMATICLYIIVLIKM